MLNAQPSEQTTLNTIDDVALPTSTTDAILFKHLMGCLIDIAKNESNDLAVFHLNKAIDYYSQNK